MGSPFFGLQIGVSALRASQQQLDTAAHNVANANTPGYSRQRVTLIAAPPFSYPAFNRSGLPGQIGSGVSIGMVSRIRDAFLDTQIQGQTALQGQWNARRDELAKVESIFPEPSDTGLGSTISKLWDSWQDVATDPTSTAARSALAEQSATFASEINRDANQLSTLATGIDYQMTQQIMQVNDLASQIANLNGQIQRVTVTGDHPNDLADQRDNMIAQLNDIVPTTVVTQSDGTMSVLVGGTDLVSGIVSRKVTTSTDAAGHLHAIWADGSPLGATSGQLAALESYRDTDLAGYRAQLDQIAAGIANAINTVHERGVDMTGAAGLPVFTLDATNAAGSLKVNPTITADPRRIAAAAVPNAPGDGSVAGLIADLRNATSYEAGTPGTDVVGGQSLATNGTATLRTIAAGHAVAQTYTFSGAGSTLTLTGADGSTQTITVPDMTAGTSQVLDFDQLGIKLTVATDSGSPKFGADIVTDLTAAGHNTVAVKSIFTPPQTTSDFYAGLIGKIGVDSGQASEMASNQQLVVDHLNQRLQQTSGVSLDEEATDMIRFQHAYQAAARVITVMDEMLNTLINNTGLAGR